MLQLVHSDVWGPTRETSHGGNRYYVSFIDDYSRKTWVYVMKNKSDVFYYFKIFKSQVEKEVNAQIKILRSDGGGEYFSNEFSNFLIENGIRRQFTCRYTPQQNGVAERKNRVIVEVARSMLNEKKMPHSFWADVVSIVVYLINRCPTAGIHALTPEEIWCDKKPDLSNLRIFGCICYVHVPSEVRSKLDAKSEKCIFIGYSLEQKGYRCYNPITKELRISRDVVFDEMASWYVQSNSLHVEELIVDENRKEYQEKSQESINLSGPCTSSPSTSIKEVSPCTTKFKKSTPDTMESTNKGKGKVDDEELWVESLNKDGSNEQDQDNKLRRSTRVRHPVQRLTYDSFMVNHFAYMSQVIKVEEPSNFEEAEKKQEWQEAMDEEILALRENGTWTLVPRNKEIKTSGCKWVLYKIKHNSNGTIARYKARLVVKGYAQKYGFDYEETFSPVAKMATIRTLLAIAAAKKWKLYQLDVKNAFLNGDLEEEIYVEQPQGYVHPDYPDYVCKLEKALYGLNQAPRAWYHKLVLCLMKQEFKELDADPSLFVKCKGNEIVVICIYVDDLIITGDNEECINDIKAKLKSEFKISDLGELRYFLGIEIIRKKEGLCLSQRKYILDMLQKFGMLACKPLQLPVDANAKFKVDEGEKIKDEHLYRSVIGSLIYVPITRQDIVHIVGVLS